MKRAGALYRWRFAVCIVSFALGAALCRFSIRESSAEEKPQRQHTKSRDERVADALFVQIAKGQSYLLPSVDDRIGDDQLYAPVAPFVSASDFARMPLRYRQSLFNMATDPKPPRFAMCFAPDSDPKIVQAFEAVRAVGLRFQFSNRWTKTATNGTGLTQGSPTTLTYSFIPDGTAIPANGSIAAESTDPSSLFAFLNGIYGTPAAWQAVFAQAFARWSALSGITYVFQATDDGASFPTSGGSLNTRGDVRIGGHSIDGPSNILAYNFFPPSFNGNNGGDMVIDTADTFFNDTGNNSLKFRNVIMHEHGHGLGFDHVCPVNQTKLMEPFVSTLFDGPQHDDIRGVQRQYGDRFKNNTTSATAANLGTLDNGLLTISDVSIDNTSETDFYKFTVQARKTATVTVRPIGFTYLEGPQNVDGTCSGGTSTNSLIINNLTVALIDTNGSTVLSSVTTSAGNPATLSGVLLTAGPGTFFVRVTGGAVADCQLYGLDISLAPFSLQWDADGSAANGANGGTGTWNTTTALWFNGASEQAWSNSAVDAAIFDGTAGAVTLGVPVTAQSLQFNVPGYSLSGSTLTLAGAAPFIDIPNGNVQISSALAGSAGLTKTSAGTLIFSGTNTYTGATTVSGGVLQAGVNNTMSSASALMLGPGTTFVGGGVSNTVGSLASSFVTTTSTFTNAATINIPTIGNASPYPSPIVVSGMPMSISSVSVTLSNFSHSFPEDVDVCLVGPQGQNVMLMSDVNNSAVTNVTLNISDAAANSFAFGSLTSNSTQNFKPTDLAGLNTPPDNFPSPGPGAGPYGGALSLFNGTNPNGTWNLFVVDSRSGQSGSILGWSITITSSGFNLTSAVSLSSGSLTAGGDNTSTTFNGVISGTGGSLTKTGTGTLTLGNTNTHTGATAVNAGTLKVNGATTLSAITVGASGTLSGVGSVGAVTCSGMVLPGDTLGTMTGVSANFSSGGALRIAIPSDQAAAQLVLSGALTMGGTSKLVIDLAGYTSGMANTNFTVAQAGSWSVLAGFTTVQVLNNTSGKSVTVKYDALSAFPNKLLNVGVGSIPTAVTIEDFDAQNEGAGGALSWTALSEIQNLGFNLYRRECGMQEWTRVNSSLISGRLTNPELKKYSFYDWPQAGRYEYKLESVSIQNIRLTHEQFAGPVEVDWLAHAVSVAGIGGAEAQIATERNKLLASEMRDRFAAASNMEDVVYPPGWGGGVRARNQARPSIGAVEEVAPAFSGPLAGWKPAQRMAVRWFSHANSSAAASHAALKVTYREPGVMLIPRASFPVGFDPEHVVVQREGRTIAPLAVTPEGLLVYGPGYRDEYTDRDALFLRRSASATNVSQPSAVSGLFDAQPHSTTPATVKAEFHDVYFDYNFRPFASAPWFSSNYLTNGSAQSFSLNTPNLAQGPATLEVKLWSLTHADASPDHALQVLLNGVAAGLASWKGGEKMVQLSFNLPSGLLREGANEIQLVTPELYGVASQIAFVYSISISYSQILDGSKPVAAINDGTGSKIFEVANLESPNAWVVDARYEDRPVLLSSETRVQGDGKFALRFSAAGGGSGKFFVVPIGQEIQPLAVALRQLRPLTDVRGSGYLAVGPSQFIAGVQPLLLARAKQGLRGTALDQERIFDAYGFGRYGPNAIQAAVRALRPQYVLLLGRTTYDYLNYSGANVDPLCPAFLVPTTLWSQTTSDAKFGDLGRGIPEVAVGRLPVNDAAELAGAVTRILNYSGAPTSGIRVHAVADFADPMAGDFPNEANSLAATFTELSWQRNYLGVTSASAPEVTDQLSAAASGGADWIVYIGHGNASRLGNEVPRILDTDKVQTWTGNVVFLQATCTAHWMALNVPGYRSIAMQGLTQPQGGICASIGTSTYMNSDVGVEFMTQVISNANRSGSRWGNALLLAQQWALRQSNNSLYQDSGWTEQLFGDPAMPVFSGAAPSAGKTVPGQF